MKRPSHKELTRKIRDAQEAVSHGRIAVINQAAVAMDALELGYDIVTEMVDVLCELLSMSRPEHYMGGRPPQRAYEREISDLELFAFVVDPERFEKPVYYKFALAGGMLWLVSLHENRM